MFAVCLVLTVQDARAGSFGGKSFDDLQGNDWTAFTSAQKETAVYTAIGGLQKHGIFVSKTPAYYIEAIDKVLALDEDMRQEYLDDIFVFCVHESEPHTQTSIAELRRKIRKEASDGKAL